MPDKGFYEYEIIFKKSKTTLFVIYLHLVPLHSNLVKSCLEVFSTQKTAGETGLNGPHMGVKQYLKDSNTEEPTKKITK